MILFILSLLFFILNTTDIFGNGPSIAANISYNQFVIGIWILLLISWIIQRILRKLGRGELVVRFLTLLYGFCIYYYMKYSDPDFYKKMLIHENKIAIFLFVISIISMVRRFIAKKQFEASERK